MFCNKTIKTLIVVCLSLFLGMSFFETDVEASATFSEITNWTDCISADQTCAIAAGRRYVSYNYDGETRTSSLRTYENKPGTYTLSGKDGWYKAEWSSYGFVTLSSYTCSYSDNYEISATWTGLSAQTMSSSSCPRYSPDVSLGLTSTPATAYIRIPCNVNVSAGKTVTFSATKIYGAFILETFKGNDTSNGTQYNVSHSQYLTTTTSEPDTPCPIMLYVVFKDGTAAKIYEADTVRSGLYNTASIPSFSYVCPPTGGGVDHFEIRFSTGLVSSVSSGLTGIYPGEVYRVSCGSFVGTADYNDSSAQMATVGGTAKCDSQIFFKADEFYVGGEPGDVVVSFYDGSTKLGTQAVEPGTSTALTTSFNPNPGDGFSFIGWAETNNTSTVKYGPGARVTTTEDIDLYAVSARTIQFVSGSGGNHTDIQQYRYNATNQKITVPTSSNATLPAASKGWSFVGWDTGQAANDTKKATTGQANFSPTATTYYAKWKRTVSVKTNGNGSTEGAVAAAATQTQYYASGGTGTSSLATWAKPSQNTLKASDSLGAFTFGNWATSKTGSAISWPLTFSPAYDASNSKTYYAIWTRKITFYNAAGTTSQVTQRRTADGNGVVTTPAFSNPYSAGNWTAIGWSSNNGSNSTVDSSLGLNITSGTVSFTPASLTYYAKWKRTVNLTLNGNGNTGGSVPSVTGQTQYYRSGGTASAVPNTWTKPTQGTLAAADTVGSFTFGGWATSKTGSDATWPQTFSPSYNAANTKTYYAVWRRTIAFYNGQNAKSTATQTHNADGNGTVITPKLSNPSSANGWKALGWAANTTANASVDTSLGLNITTETEQKEFYPGSLTYYAKWSRTLTVSYNANGGSGTTANTTKIQYYNSGGNISSNSITLASNSFTPPTGNEFVNWGSNASGTKKFSSGSAYTELGGTVASTASTTLYAQWQSANRAPTITVQPTNTSFVYGNTGTMSVTATKASGSTLSYQWQSSQNGTSWANVSGATNATYTIPATTKAGTLYYRCVITSKLSGVSNLSTTSNAVSAVISKRTLSLAWGNREFVYDTLPHAPSVTLGNITNWDLSAVTVTVSGSATHVGNYVAEATNLSDSDNYQLPAEKTTAFKIVKADGSIRDSSGLQIINNKKYVLTLSNESTELLSGLVPAESEGIIYAASSDISKVEAELTDDGVLLVKPVGTTDVAQPVRVTVTASETANYNGCEYVLYIYVCSGPKVEVFYDPETDTLENVSAKLHITDPFTAIDPSHVVSGVTIGGEPKPILNGLCEYVFTDNASNIEYVAFDSFGGTTKGRLSVDWIDREAPRIILSVYESSKTDAFMQAIAYDNRTITAELEYCWNYTNTSADVWVRDEPIKGYAIGNTVVVAVRDRVGNVGIAEGKARRGSVSDVVDELSVRTQKLVNNVSGDLSGDIFGRSLYMLPDGTIKSYETDPVRVTVKITQAVPSMFVEGYLAINGQKVPLTWYQDAELTLPSGVVSSDGKSVSLWMGESGYGTATLDPGQFVIRTVRNASAVIHLITYDDTNREKKLTSEQYAMSYSVDLTPPSIALTYNAYTRKLDLRVTDALSGVAGDKALLTIQNAQEVSSTYSTTYPSSGTDAFPVTVEARDKLGNSATLTKGYTPATGGDDGHGTGTSGVFNPGENGDVNAMFSRSRLFNKYLINGSYSNSNVSSVPAQ